jgi:uncharacterized protein YgiM (DUF1202 family)
VIRAGVLALAVAAASLASAASAATAYVSDELVLNVYAEQNQQGQRLATLHSGARVETLATSADFTQVQLPDGITGWVKSSYLTTQVPAAVRVKQLEEELDRSRATTPELAQAAAKSETQRLRSELADTQSQLAAALAARSPASSGNEPSRDRGMSAGLVFGIAVGGAAAGFWAGYVTLARRVRRKFGGLKVY